MSNGAAKTSQSVWKQWKAAKSGLSYTGFKHSLRPLMSAAHCKVHRAIKCGDLDPASHFDCVDCGGQAEVYDHRDYTKPLDVQPVCRRCNNKRGAGAPYA
jgi:hypothetical protein